VGTGTQSTTVCLIKYNSNRNAATKANRRDETAAHQIESVNNAREIWKNAYAARKAKQSQLVKNAKLSTESRIE